MTAPWFWARAELRARWRSWVVLGLLTGATAGLVTAGVAGARRTEDALPNYIAAGGPALDAAVTRLRDPLIPGLILGLLSALLAMSVLLPYSFPDWDLRGLRDRYVRAATSFARLHIVDTQIVMVDRMKQQLARKTTRLKAAIALLAAAAVALAAGSIVPIGG